jgi:hypothetical protein
MLQTLAVDRQWSSLQGCDLNVIASTPTVALTIARQRPAGAGGEASTEWANMLVKSSVDERVQSHSAHSTRSGTVFAAHGLSRPSCLGFVNLR